MTVEAPTHEGAKAGGVLAPAPRFQGAWRRFRWLTPYLFVLPGFAVLATFQLYPIAQGFFVSLHNWTGVSASPDAFVGLSNYTRLMNDAAFWASMRNAAGFGIIGVAIGGGLGLGMALLVNTMRRGAALFRALFFLPWMLSVVVFGFLWDWLLDPTIGTVNRLLTAIGLENFTHAWLGDPSTAFGAVAFIYVWAYWGFSFLVFLSGLQSIPDELLDAAAIDGANALQRFRYVIWPLLLPITVVATVITLLLAMQIFGTVLVTTNGGPGYRTEVPTLRIYKEAFVHFRVGSAAAMSVIFGFVLVILSFVQLWFAKRYSYEY